MSRCYKANCPHRIVKVKFDVDFTTVISRQYKVGILWYAPLQNVTTASFYLDLRRIYMLDKSVRKRYSLLMSLCLTSLDMTHKTV